MMAKWTNTDWVPYGDTMVPMETTECDEECSTCEGASSCPDARYCELCGEYYHRTYHKCPYGCEEEEDI